VRLLRGVQRLFGMTAVLCGLVIGTSVAAHGQYICSVCCQGCPVISYTSCYIGCPCVYDAPPPPPGQYNMIFIVSCDDGFIGCCGCCQVA
jgi:hypothetical protein